MSIKVIEVNTSSDFRKALNANRIALLTKKRDIDTAKQENNALGKMLADVRNEIIVRTINMDEDRGIAISWYPEVKSSKKSKK